MHDDRRDETDAHLSQADAVWLAEIAGVFGEDRVDACAAGPEGRGEPGSALRRAYEERQRAYAQWRRARGLG